MCLGGCMLCVCLCQMNVCTHGGQKNVTEPLKLEFQAAVN